MKTKITFILLAIAVCASCWAPVKDPRKDKAMRAEITQQELEQQQALQRTQRQVGIVPMVSDDHHPAPDSQFNSKGTQDLLGAQQVMSRSQQDLLNANKRLESAKTDPVKTGIWASALLAIGLLMAYSFRQWAERTNPFPKQQKNKSSW